METKNKKDFKAVDFMRKVREEMSALYNTDKKRYFEEIKKAMADFKRRQKKAFNQQ
jgi:hypothetical protein